MFFSIGLLAASCFGQQPSDSPTEPTPSVTSDSASKNSESGKEKESKDSSQKSSTNAAGKYLPPANRFTRPGPAPVEIPKTPEQIAKERKDREAARKRGEITFDDLKFEMEKGSEFKPEMLSTENKQLDKKTWKLRGFILPTTLFSNSNIKEFVLVRDNQECCFGPGAALYDCVMVTMAPGKSISFSPRLVTVKGKLEIDTETFRNPEDDSHFAVYKMTADEVK